ncbi:MAG: efflux RND transporter periplasmic adaptor subunit [Magnetococcales bacterium]|nr:efflux RND transporter periplasmic adaptor subunit [Magnetococcales bacterium]
MTEQALSTQRADPWLTLGRDDDARAHATWLECLVAGMGGGLQEAVLVLEDPVSRGFHPAAVWPAEGVVSPDLAQLSEQALEKRIPLTAYRGRGLMAWLVEYDGAVRGVVALAFAGTVPRHAVSWLRWGQGWLERAWREEDGQAEAELRERLLLALDLTMVALEAANAEAAVHAVATEAAARLECDRVSVGFLKGSEIRFAALSHSVDVARRIDLIHAIVASMNEAMEQATPIHVGLYTLPGNASHPNDPGEPNNPGHSDWINIREHQRLVRDFGSESVLSVPFAAGDNDTRRMGVFLFEWAQAVAEVRLRQAETLTPILGRVLLNRRRVERSLYERLLEGTEEEGQQSTGPSGRRRKLLAALSLAVTLFFSVTEGDYRLSATASLEGGIRRVVVAPFDGYVASARVRAGQVVRKGEELARLDDRDIRLEISRWTSQQAQYQKQTDDAQAQHNLAQIQIALAQARQAAAQRELSEAMLARARIIAPFDGVIVSGDLSQHLGGSLTKGQTLFEIAPLNAYRVALLVEEFDIGQVAVGQKGELMLAALPGRTFPFHVSLVTPVATVSDGRNQFRVEATLADGDERLRPGMEGVGKIDIGRELLIWIWTHRFLEWLRLQTWSLLGL